MVIEVTYFDNTKINLNNIDEIYDLKNPENVIKLYLYNNELTTLPENIFNNLTQLQVLSLNNNNLTNLPENIFNNLTQLQNLDLFNNNLTTLPDNIFNNLIQLQELYLSENNLTTLPENIFNNLTQLRTLYLAYNNLTTLPNNIFSSLTQLQHLYLSYNNLINLPISITRLNLVYYDFNDNELDITNPIINRWYNRLLNHSKNSGSIYNDSQNVHNQDINNGILKAINYLCARDIKPIKDELIAKLMDNSKIEDRVKQLMMGYFEDDYVHSVTNVSLLDLFLMSFDIIIDKGIEDIMNDAISSGECKCLTGIQNRYVNIFNGIIPECSFELLDGSVFGALFSHLVEKYNGDKDKIKEELLERGYEEDYITEWIEAL